MRVLKHLFDNNRAWAEQIREQRPGVLRPASRASSRPRYLWIGCSDSRVPANQIVGLLPGRDVRPPQRRERRRPHRPELPVGDAVRRRRPQGRHIIVCGHYGCGGVRAALRRDRLGLSRQLAAARPGRAREARRSGSAAMSGEARPSHRLCELNVIEQVVNVCQTTAVRDAWARGRSLAVHGWIYDVTDGLLRDLGLCVTCPDDVAASQGSSGQSR